MATLHSISIILLYTTICGATVCSVPPSREEGGFQLCTEPCQCQDGFTHCWIATYTSRNKNTSQAHCSICVNNGNRNEKEKYGIIKCFDENSQQIELKDDKEESTEKPTLGKIKEDLTTEGTNVSAEGIGLIAGGCFLVFIILIFVKVYVDWKLRPLYK